MAKIKICGLTRSCDIEAVNECLPDYAGFVFAESRRRISPQTAFELREMLDSRIRSVGVFVDADSRFIADICLRDIIDIVQLHGNEDEEYIRTLRERTGKPVIKAVRVRSRQDIAAAERLSCDYLLLDAFVHSQVGGTGEAFDWAMAVPNTENDRISKPFFLAGGLNSRNILDAIEKVDPFGVDVSSGVETGGYKDRDKILEIVSMVRSYSRRAEQAGRGE